VLCTHATPANPTTPNKVDRMIPQRMSPLAS
jgi:hypothetical protein